MKVSFTFLDKEEWSFFATLNTIVILIIMSLGMNINNLKPLVFASLISMLQGPLLAKLIFTFFLCMVIWGGQNNFIIASIFTLLACLVVHFIEKENKVNQYVQKSNLLKMMLRISIAVWMIYVSYLLFKILKIKLIK